MPTLEERLATLEESNRTLHADMVELKLLLEGVRPFQLESARVTEWQKTIIKAMEESRQEIFNAKARVTSLEMWRAYMLGGLSVLTFLMSSGIIALIVKLFS